MSREQWGHGYWKGVQDAASGNVARKFKDVVLWVILKMCISNGGKSCDRGLFKVKDFVLMCEASGIPRSFAKRIYDYVLANMPHNCYISGAQHWDWMDDYFVLPFFNVPECMRRANAIEKTWYRENERREDEQDD